MGLDLASIRMKFLERPSGLNYKLAWELAHKASEPSFTWGCFTQQQVLRVLREFAKDNDCTDAQVKSLMAWLCSLPWENWDDKYEFDEGLSDEDEEFASDDEGGGRLELYFSF